MKWSLKGVIVEGRVSEDGTVRLYVVKKENGRETIRSSRHIKFATKKSEKRIRFDDSENEAIETDDDLVNNTLDTATEHETHEGLEHTADRESLGPAQRAESGPAQRTRQRLAWGAGGPAVRVF